MTKLAQHLSAANTPQTSRLPGERGKRQVQNSAGGYVFQAAIWDRLMRFLILGTDGGSYYAGERELTIENAECIGLCADADFGRTLKTIVEVSDAGRAVKNDYAILALAILYARGGDEGRAALAELNKVCRIGTHLFQFVDSARQLRGSGRAFRRALAEWYYGKTPASAAYQVVKYQKRNGYSHRDVLRLAKPKPRPGYAGVFAYAVGKPFGHQAEGDPEALRLLEAVQAINSESNLKQVCKLIADHKLPRECVPTRWLTETAVWDELLPHMGLTALIRSLGKLSAMGYIVPLGRRNQQILDKLSNRDDLKSQRVHPLSLLVAMMTYTRGRGLKGSLTWQVSGDIKDALENAYYAAFDFVEPTNKRYLLGVDVSGSMAGAQIAGLPLSAHQAATAMAMTAVRTEPQTHTMAFTRSFIPLPISRNTSLPEALRLTQRNDFGSTDCALPMTYAQEHELEVDVFVVYTDSETWAGRIQPAVALDQYRRTINPAAKLIVCGMVSNQFSIADPNDPGMLDVVGFDTATPTAMAHFVNS